MDMENEEKGEIIQTLNNKIVVQRNFTKNLIAQNKDLIHQNEQLQIKLKKKHQKVKSIKSQVGYKDQQLKQVNEEKKTEREKKLFYLDKCMELQQQLDEQLEKNQRLKIQAQLIEIKLGDIKKNLNKI